MIKGQQTYKWVLFVFICLIILMAILIGYHQIINTPATHKLKQSYQTGLVDTPIKRVKEVTRAEIPNTTLGKETASGDVIHPKDYQQFWIWTAPKDDSKLSQAHTLYILQGEIRPQNVPYYRPNTNKHAIPATLTPQGLGVRSLSKKKIWLVYRATSQDWSYEVMTQLINRLDKWQRSGNDVKGIQIDFDAPTYQLDAYVVLLKTIRKQLPQHYQLSVTGLLDWANQADDPAFIGLGDTVDELVMQTYQGTGTLPNYSQYLKELEDLSFDFKVGVIEGGQWQGAAFLENNPHFKGYVVFLQ